MLRWRPLQSMQKYTPLFTAKHAEVSNPHMAGMWCMTGSHLTGSPRRVFGSTVVALYNCWILLPHPHEKLTDALLPAAHRNAFCVARAVSNHTAI